MEMGLTKWGFVVFLALTLIFAIIGVVLLAGPNPDLSNTHPLMMIGFAPLVALLVYIVISPFLEDVDW